LVLQLVGLRRSLVRFATQVFSPLRSRHAARITYSSHGWISPGQRDRLGPWDAGGGTCLPASRRLSPRLEIPASRPSATPPIPETCQGTSVASARSQTAATHREPATLGRAAS